MFMNAVRSSSAMAASWRHAENRNEHSVFPQLPSRSGRLEMMAFLILFVFYFFGVGILGKECVDPAQPP
jgi:hypothetical protein